ncbi:MAG: CpXC domain-containing protein [Anaerolineae bacterium]
MVYYARAQCPACGTAFQLPVEQILDVRVDPKVKQRLLSGTVNVARCPACGWTGHLNVPFIYHDPEKEVALLYLPTEAGRNEAERQQAAGRLTRQLSNSLPAEERKGYLLNPETFITLDSLVHRVLELEGISEEQIARSQDQQQLLQDLLSASEEEWEEMVEERGNLVDEGFFYLLNSNLRFLQAMKEQSEEEGETLPPQLQEALDKVEALENYLTETHETGRRLESRTEALRPFLEDPNRETLLEALIAAPDDDTVEMLVQSGVQWLNYGFFQKLSERIEKAQDEATRERLTALRGQILDLREELQKSSEALLMERAQLLRKLLETEEPLKMARSHLSELDEAFSYVFQSHMQRARERGDRGYLSELEALTDVLDQLFEQSMPPQVALVRRLLMTSSDEEVTKMLEANRQIVTESFLEFLTAVEESMQEEGETEVIERLRGIRRLARRFVSSSPSSQREGAEVPPSEPLGPGEKLGPGGLIISKK